MWEGIIPKDTKHLLRQWIDAHCERADNEGPDYYRVDELETLTESAYRLGFGHGIATLRFDPASVGTKPEPLCLGCVEGWTAFRFQSGTGRIWHQNGAGQRFLCSSTNPPRLDADRA